MIEVFRLRFNALEAHKEKHWGKGGVNEHE